MIDSIGESSGAAAQRWPDNQVRLGAPPGRAGYWVSETNVLVEDGVRVKMLPNGQVVNLADAPKVAPLQRWALPVRNAPAQLPAQRSNLRRMPAIGDEFYLDAGNLLYYGRNTAHWEGDTFVIESNGYDEEFWLPGGLPHSELLHSTERLTRTDYDTLR